MNRRSASPRAASVRCNSCSSALRAWANRCCLGCRRGLGDPQRRHGRFGNLPGTPLGEGVLVASATARSHGAKLAIMTFRLGLDGAPAGMEQQCLGAADVLAEAAIALRLARLLLQRLSCASIVAMTSSSRNKLSSAPLSRSSVS